MIRLLSLRNRQRVCAVNTALLRRIARRLLQDHLRTGGFELAIHLVAAPEISDLNRTFLRHVGSTDVITFNHATANTADCLHGEIFICLEEALTQSRVFKTCWQSELTRYLIHGLLHLQGHDDRRPAARRRMKREEDRLLRAVSRRFALSQLGSLNAKLKPMDAPRSVRSSAN